MAFAGRPEAKRIKRGWRIFPPDKRTNCGVGVRIGAALRRGYHVAETGEGAERAEERAGPRPHTRRAYWHGHWSGPRSEPKARNLDLRWIPPIPVKIANADGLPATVRKVRR